jgi:hypothetical protein
MKYLLLAIVFVAAFSASLSAQQQPLGFAGTWILDEENTFDREIDRKAISDYVMEISETSDTFLIKVVYKLDKRPVSYELKLFKDGRGEVNKLDPRISETSETTAAENKITRKYTRNRPGPRPVEGVDEFLLSKDRSKLIRRRTEDKGTSNLPSRFPGGGVIQLPPNTPPTLVLKRRSGT